MKVELADCSWHWELNSDRQYKTESWATKMGTKMTCVNHLGMWSLHQTAAVAEVLPQDWRETHWRPGATSLVEEQQKYLDEVWSVLI